MSKEYAIKDSGDVRILDIEGKEYRTYYSRKVIELLIQRKGLARAPLYFIQKTERSRHLHSLFNYLNKNTKNLKVLEVGCSAGHITEYLNEQPCIEEIYTFDVDRAFVEITRLKKDELNLHKVKFVDHFSIRETSDLPYEDNFFDLIIVLAIVEHLPFENRHLYIDAYYRALKVGGIIGFWDTPNRYFFLDTHSTRLPFIQWFSPHFAYFYARLFRRLKGGSFPGFVRAGAGWRNATYYELLPKTLMIDVKDISDEIGYSYKNSFTKLSTTLCKLFARLCNVPAPFFTHALNVVFRKTHDYE